MSEEQLQQLVERISIDVFHKPFLHQAVFNSRLRTTGGRYKLADHFIEINPLVIELHDEEELIGIIKHELCHYHLHLEGKGYKHGDQDFKQLLKQTNSPRHCKPLVKRPAKRALLHMYRCTACGLDYPRRRRMDCTKYRCGKCAGKIMKVE
ncbi:SprT family protein [Sporosarcina sp. P37]|uniref:SprT family protein n=1 Tax=unclassified Sporosarcina TaxID=2647733 RepID=UPI000A17E7D2|nr:MULTISPECIES: SprT family protein [unclassified Sporosarcina]ARK24520.1 SprT family protein [Sporosarcina sp. P37]PID19676.1 SprT family protein [Sporosarcina sp. P35]